MASTRVSGVRLESVLQQACEPLFWLNPDHKLIWVNRAWEELTGHSAESVQGLVCKAHGPTHAGDLAGLGGSFYPPVEALAGRPAGGPTLIIHAGGEHKWRRVDYLPTHDANGAPLGMLGVVGPVETPTIAADADAQRLRSELLEVRNRLHGRYGIDTLIGRGPEHQRLLEQVGAAAATTVPVLIVGEPGTGKRLLARTIHQKGAKSNAPLVPLDCAALPAEILTRALFRSEREEGAPPRLTMPEGATLLIGDVVDLPRDLQAVLATTLDQGVRVLATTTRDPETAIKTERLRSDLYYALSALVIRPAHLRERRDELPLLAQHMLERVNLRDQRQRSGFSAGALAIFLAYDWPGNLRELARVIEAAHQAASDDRIEAEDIPAGIRGHQAAAYLPPPIPTPITPLDELLTQVELRLIENAMKRAGQNKSRAAELLGISRPRLYRRVRELNLPDEPEPFEETSATSNHASGP